MQILVTGGCGFIGSHMVVELVKKYDCIIVDNLSNSKRSIVDKMEKIVGKKIKFYEMDLCNKEDVEKIFRKNVIDAVIHFAGLKAVNESVKNPVMYYKNNLTSTLNLLEVMRKYKVLKFIFSSSATVYGENESPLREEMRIGEGITNPYGRTKYMIEEILKDYSNTDKKLQIICLRYFNPVGAHISGLIGEDPNGVPNNIMPYINRVALQNNTMHYLDDKYKKLQIFGGDYKTEDGTAVRDYIHIDDLIEGHIKALEKIRRGFNRINLGTGKGVSVLELVRTYEKINNVKIPFEIVDRREGDLEEVFCDCKKAKNDIDWEAKKTVEEMCLSSWNYQCKNEPSLIVSNFE